MLTGNEIRQKFLKYFESKKHHLVSSSSLVPFNDPTLFFVNAGMVPFKNLFTGEEKHDYTRAVSSQKCMRVSGKHNDLENVGRTPRHHTFFEMLGNFSFGDYFKKEAIVYAWEFLTETVKIPADVLWVTVFREDFEAEKLWQKEVNFPQKRMIRLDEADNFWSMGEVGPCGPCSEIHIDLGATLKSKPSPGNPATHPDDFMEIWNLVFMQFERTVKGAQTPLPKPSIDTGMGLERLAAVLQKKNSNYETDLFFPLIHFFSKRTGVAYGKNPEQDVSLRVLADHLRAMTFLIGDGVLPSNEGRGYVLRRIMRRAIRHGRLLKMNEPFFYEGVKTLVAEMRAAYPDLEKNQEFILKAAKIEEENFLETLEKGLKMIEEETSHQKGKIFDGATAFKLYDTFGFPLDLTEIILAEKGMSVDKTRFDSAMEDQKRRARAAWKGSGQEKVGAIYQQLVQEKGKTPFVGYDGLEANSTIVALIKEGNPVEQAENGVEVEVISNDSPFYGESGGQVGDKGVITSGKAKLEIDDTQKPVDGLIVHQGKVISGLIKVGDKIHLQVNLVCRRSTMLNHTATHILHAALRELLGDHVKQAGSLVTPDRLRFDFSHFAALTREEIQKIERRVNEVIQANYVVTKEEHSFDEAKKKGATAFFGDKYGDRVRVVTIGPYSMELCGGTHLDASGEIGIFKITSESSVASGVRRIEAVTGMKAIALFQEMEALLGELASLLKSSPEELSLKIKKTSERIRELEQEITRLKSKVASGGGGGSDYLQNVKEIKGVRFLSIEIEMDDPKALREFSDQVKSRLGSGIAVIAAKGADKVLLIVTVSADLTAKYNAGKIISEIAPIVGGKGGGRPDMAQAGGPDVSKLSEALKKAESLI